MTNADDTAARSGIDTSVPHSARIWNYWLGGKDNYAADREAGDAWIAVHPQITSIARQQRAFLGRVVRYLVNEAGVDQFLDIGTGLPTVDNTHEVAQRHNPAARIVYVDNDPLVLAHARALLTSTPQGVTRYVPADMHDADALTEQAGQVLDLNRPVAVLILGVLGHVPDDGDARALVDGLMGTVPSGSYLAIADGTNPTVDSGRREAEQQYAATGAEPYRARDIETMQRFFAGLEWVEPGFCRTADWRPDTPDTSEDPGPDPVVAGGSYAGLARKP